MYGGMYPEHILDDDGKKVANAEATQNNKECKQCIYFLDMEILQNVANSNVR